MRRYFRRCYKRWQVTHLAVRYLLLVAVGIVTLAGGILGNQLIRTFASSPCATGDLVYTVVSGDTLSGIAARYSTGWSQLASYNHLSNANLKGANISNTDFTGVKWKNTTCPDGTNSDTNDSNSCVGH